GTGNSGLGSAGGGIDSRDGSAGYGGGMTGSSGMGASPTPAEQQYTSSDGSVRISSVDGSNQLLVRARASQWEEIKAAIARCLGCDHAANGSASP
ncbi:MAG: hypothetical protein ABI155_08750, partial [Paralcaligenes sp.]